MPDSGKFYFAAAVNQLAWWQETCYGNRSGFLCLLVGTLGTTFRLRILLS